MSWIETRHPITICIAGSTEIEFEPVHCVPGKYRAKDPLSIMQIVALIVSRSELKDKSLYVHGCCPVVNRETAVLLAAVANENAHGIEQRTSEELGKSWTIIAIPFAPQEKEKCCHLGLEVSL